MTRSAADLTALLGSRICHDLISPLGAISNGVELLTMTGATGPEIELITESVANANARIRFFRVAFGAASQNQAIGAGEVRAILADVTDGTKLRFDWLPEGDVPRLDAKLVFLLLQCFETAMPWGGSVTVSKAGDHWTVAGTAERLKLDAALWDGLADPNSGTEYGAAEVHFLLLPILLDEAGRSLELALSETEINARL